MSEIQKPAREVVEGALLFGRQLEKVIELARYVESVENQNPKAIVKRSILSCTQGVVAVANA